MLVIVESPYAGNIALNTIYAQFAMHDCLVNYGEAPYASHLLYTQDHVLRDEIPEDRKLGIEAGFLWREVATGTAFYYDLGISAGMQQGMDDCDKKRTNYAERRLPDYLWIRFCHACGEKGLPIPER